MRGRKAWSSRSEVRHGGGVHQVSRFRSLVLLSVLCALGISADGVADPLPQTANQAQAPILDLILRRIDAAQFRLSRLKSMTVRQKVSALVSRMTLDEKVGQLNLMATGKPTGPATRPHAAPLEQLAREGKLGAVIGMVAPEELNELQRAAQQSRLGLGVLATFDAIHSFKTAFPTPLAVASTMDPRFAELAGREIGREAAASGLHCTFAPDADLARNAKWGRGVETSGENPVLAAAMVEGWIRGFRQHLCTTLKHFVAYGAAASGRDYDDTYVTWRELQELYFPSFKRGLAAGADMVMASFNAQDGTPMHANRHLFQLLRSWPGGKDVVVTSDWTGINELVPHGVATSDAEASRRAFDAGIDIDMESGAYLHHLAGAVRAGRISMTNLDAAVARVLMLKAKVGLFDPQRLEVDVQRAHAELDAPGSRALAREVAEKSIVLLKNSGPHGPVLPLTGSPRVAVVGPSGLVDDPGAMLGPWSGISTGADAVSLWQGLSEKARDKGITLVRVEGGTIDRDGSGSDDEKRIAQAVKAVQGNNVVVAFVGETPNLSGEARSRADIELPGNQRKLLRALKSTGIPLVVVVTAGRAEALSWEAENADALIFNAFLGSEAGRAMASVLVGEVNPSGKLPVTLPRNLGQVPITSDSKSTGRPANGPERPGDYLASYIDSSNLPLFPLGSGIGYSKMHVDALRVLTPTVPTAGRLRISVNVTNQGSRSGEEVVQLYTHPLRSNVTVPLRALRAMKRVALDPGETKTLEIELPAEELATVDVEGRRAVEPGEVELYVGTDAQATLRGTFVLRSF